MHVFDSHVHLWDPQRLRYEWLSGELDRPFLPADLTAAFGGGRARERVFIQAECVPQDAEAEVDWVTSIADETGVVGIVAYVPLEDPFAAEAALDRLVERPLVVGARRMLQSEPDSLLTSAGLRAGCRELAARGLTFDACVGPEQLPALSTIADAAPALSIVLDHLGKPRIGSCREPLAPTREWLADLRELARRPSVVCKISGLPAEATGPWCAETVAPFLDAALESFGSERLLYGSDWPVSGPARQWERTVSEWASDRLGADASQRIMSTNGRRIYLTRPPVTTGA